MVKIPYRTTCWQKNYLGGSRNCSCDHSATWSYRENNPDFKDKDMDSLGMESRNKGPDSESLPGLFRTSLPLWIWLHMTPVQLHEKVEHSWT